MDFFIFAPRYLHYWPKNVAGCHSGGSLIPVAHNLCVRVLHVVEESVFGTYQEVRAAVFVEVHCGWTCCVARQDAIVDHSFVAENMLAAVVRDVSQETDALAIDQNIQPAVEVPIGKTELAPAALAGGTVVQSQQAAGLALCAMHRIEHGNFAGERTTAR